MVMWNDMISLFREYMGTGLILIWYLISLIYLWMREKRKNYRILFIYMPIIFLLLFFNPLFAKVIYIVADDEIYYRILWLLPITMTIAFTLTDIYGRLDGVRKRFFPVVAGLLIMVSGSFIYTNPHFGPAENIYHVPQSVVDICDAIEVEGREVTAVFPEEMLQYVRQYSGSICMPYGREITVGKWVHVNELYPVMEAETVDAVVLTNMARQQACIYIILPKDKKITGDMAACQFEVFDEMHGYLIYKDSNVNL